jgi:hypothetical protein
MSRRIVIAALSLAVIGVASFAAAPSQAQTPEQSAAAKAAPQAPDESASAAATESRQEPVTVLGTSAARSARDAAGGRPTLAPRVAIERK